ncbi:hypothetical protein FAF44_02600 [Nonomuraea sp. MG754425]|uniref:hypothetical protein n=1 Tax=Nonomuraea sp. MG754425 TaxID=2570319 RepID=UPI001F3CC019|nr:hypothetical protein [Nonomuraea sp. MG754425]MCF6467303.1 hypothetical protein [Nonomuraea sp. MG754425]
MPSTTRKPVKFGIRLLNHPAYQDPDGFHTYVTTWNDGRRVLHLPICPLAKEAGASDERETTYRRAMDAGMRQCRHCLPHSIHHVTLPDGTKRYRPMSVIFTGGNLDGYEYGEYALVEKTNGTWQVRRWAESGEAAVKLAVELGVPYILGPRHDSLGLPTPIREEDL